MIDPRYDNSGPKHAHQEEALQQKQNSEAESEEEPGAESGRQRDERNLGILRGVEQKEGVRNDAVTCVMAIAPDR
jgi:hypothetical protein